MSTRVPLPFFRISSAAGCLLPPNVASTWDQTHRIGKRIAKCTFDNTDDFHFYLNYQNPKYTFEDTLIKIEYLKKYATGNISMSIKLRHDRGCSWCDRYIANISVCFVMIWCHPDPHISEASFFTSTIFNFAYFVPSNALSQK